MANGSNTSIQEYIDGIIKAVSTAPQTCCGNQAVNATISHYAAMCREQEIELTIQLTVSLHTDQIIDMKLCVIFGNFLENAVVACRRMTEGRRFIWMNSVVQLGTLIITMDNSFDERAKL